MELERVPRWPVFSTSTMVICSIVAGVILTWHFLAPIPLCPFRNVTGFPCPGCGSTRAVIDLAQGRFAEAWCQQPLLLLLGAAAAAVVTLRVGFGRSLRIQLSSVQAIALGAVVVTLLLLNWGYLILSRPSES